jgi:hypothetical protein
MSELPLNHEQGELDKQPKNNEQATNRIERELTDSEKEHGSNEQLEKLQRHVESQALSKHEHPHSEKEHNAQQHPVLIRKDIKEIQFNRAMTRVRKKLSVPSRAFSRVIHVSAIDKSSEFIGKTVARPSGLLAGSVIAFVGTSILLWVTRYNGYEYNYLLVILLFVGGLIIGTAAEGLWRLLRKK